MTDGPLTNITKQDAASGQLVTAVALFFCDDDPISIHVLASSASQILYDVCKHKGVTSIRDVWLDYIVDEYETEWIRKTKQAYNYFKHAKDDPFTALERFDPRSNECRLLEACIDYLTVYKFPQSPLEVRFYFTWFLITHPRIIRRGHPLTEFVTTAQSLNELREQKSPDEQRKWAADLLRATYELWDQRPPVTGLKNDASEGGEIIGRGKITEYWGPATL